jgi:hypothetical protein
LMVSWPLRDGTLTARQSPALRWASAGRTCHDQHEAFSRACIRSPPFLRPEVKAQGQTHEAYKNGSTIEAIPEGQDIIRSKVISSILMDELGFHETSQNNWDAALPAAQGGGHLWGVTTPNGHDFVYDQADADQPWDDCVSGGDARPDVTRPRRASCWSSALHGCLSSDTRATGRDVKVIRPEGLHRRGTTSPA